MSPEEFEKLEKIINRQIDSSTSVAIEKYVNGKIRAIDTKLDNYIKDDNEWKERAKPTIELGDNIRGFGKVFVYILGIGATLYALITNLKK